MPAASPYLQLLTLTERVYLYVATLFNKKNSNKFKPNTVEILDSGVVQGKELINYVCPFFEKCFGGFFVHWQIQ